MGLDRRLTALYAAGWAVSAVLMAAVYRQWKARLREAEERAAEIERTHQEAIRRESAEERVRIARDLHDSLTHSISVVKIQAAVAAHLARKRGEEVPEPLRAIEEAAGEAARELRATLSVLRESASDHGLERLGQLVARTTAAGVPTTLTTVGLPDGSADLPSEISTTAYRIVQESLTNVARHAGNASASVTVSRTDGLLVVEVRDDGDGSAGTPLTPGHGIIGMRERAAGVGGSLHVGGDAEGFTVRAELPLGSPT
ncbi:MAG: sensor histidine kinase [Nocardioides sp.]|uniref:sensor histidine kinase n=1 Tax=Nocardioides sp. TaxID=35761 RepID=UPI0039E2AD23